MTTEAVDNMERPVRLGEIHPIRAVHEGSWEACAWIFGGEGRGGGGEPGAGRRPAHIQLVRPMSSSSTTHSRPPTTSATEAGLPIRAARQPGRRPSQK